MLRAITLTLTCAVLALAAAACGESGSSDDDLATLVPADAQAYVEATLRPEGEQRDDALAAAGKLLRTDDPSGKLRELVDKALAERDPALTWEQDIEPWLGDKAALWAFNMERDAPSYAAIVATTDPDRAAEEIEALGETDPKRKRSHAGVEYQIGPDGTVTGVIDDFVVVGTEDAFKRTVDTSKDGAALADADRYRQAVDRLSDDRLGLFFMDSRALFQAGLEQDPQSAAEFEQFTRIFPVDRLGPTVGSFQADGETLAFDSVTLDVPEGPMRTLFTLFGAGESELTAELPGDAWGTFVMPRLGEAAQETFTDVAGALGGAAAAAQVKEATGLDLEEDVFSWIGDTGMFVRGTSPAEVDGAVVIQSTDDAKASAAFGKIVGLIGREAAAPPEPVRLDGAESAFSLASPDIPKPIVIARGEGRVVVAYGEEAARAALDPAAKLGDAEVYDGVKDSLGEELEPAFLLSMPSVVELVDATGGADPEWQEFKPYLESIEAIASGGKLDGDAVKSRLVVTLK